MNADSGWFPLFVMVYKIAFSNSAGQQKSVFISGIKKQYCQAPA
jgi:hypothetical protein